MARIRLMMRRPGVVCIPSSLSDVGSTLELIPRVGHDIHEALLGSSTTRYGVPITMESACIIADVLSLGFGVHFSRNLYDNWGSATLSGARNWNRTVVPSWTREATKI